MPLAPPEPVSAAAPGTTLDTPGEQRAREATAVSLERHRELLGLAEQQCQLAGEGRIQELAALCERWDALAAALAQSPPPPAAAPLLARARLLTDRVRVELLRMREAVLADVDATARAGRAASTYALQAPPSRHVDHCA